jgi:hypothetical protein
MYNKVYLIVKYRFPSLFAGYVLEKTANKKLAFWAEIRSANSQKNE